MIWILIHTEGVPEAVQVLLLVFGVADELQFFGPVTYVGSLPFTLFLLSLMIRFSVLIGSRRLLLRWNEHALFLSFNNDHLWLDWLIKWLIVAIIIHIESNLELCKLNDTTKVESQKVLILEIFWRLYVEACRDWVPVLSLVPDCRLQFFCLLLASWTVNQLKRHGEVTLLQTLERLQSCSVILFEPRRQFLRTREWWQSEIFGWRAIEDSGLLAHLSDDFGGLEKFVVVFLKNEGRWYRVSLGKFEADSLANELEDILIEVALILYTFITRFFFVLTLDCLDLLLLGSLEVGAFLDQILHASDQELKTLCIT